MITIHSLVSTVFLAQAAGGAKSQGFDASQLIMPVALVVIFYFLLIRPQQRQRKEAQARISALQSGDKVVTTAGIHGIVHTVKESTVMVKVAEGTFMEFDKPAISVVRKKETEEK